MQHDWWHAIVMCRRARLVSLLFVCVLLLFILSCTPSGPTVVLGGMPVRVTLANTPELRERGLMNVSSLAHDAGMLFIFDKEQPVAFWMKNMSMSIDIIFLDSNKTVVDVWANATPCGVQCQSYKARLPVRYVLEVNAGFAQMHAIREGSVAQIHIPE